MFNTLCVRYTRVLLESRLYVKRIIVGRERLSSMRQNLMCVAVEKNYFDTTYCIMYS